MNHKAFVNVVCFGQHNDYNFLECTTADQRTIAESLLSLEIFKEFCTSAKEELKEFKAQVKELTAAYEQIVLSEETCANRILQIDNQQKEWEAGCIIEIDESNKQLTQIETELTKHIIECAWDQAMRTILKSNFPFDPAKCSRPKIAANE